MVYLSSKIVAFWVYIFLKNGQIQIVQLLISKILLELTVRVQPVVSINSFWKVFKNYRKDKSFPFNICPCPVKFLVPLFVQVHEQLLAVLLMQQCIRPEQKLLSNKRIISQDSSLFSPLISHDTHNLDNIIQLFAFQG